MICSHCGQQNPDYYQFCPSCGVPLAPASSPATAQKQPPSNPPHAESVARPVSPPHAQKRDVSYLLEDDEPKKSRVAPVIVVLSLIALGAFGWWELRPLLQQGGTPPAETATNSAPPENTLPTAATPSPTTAAPPTPAPTTPAPTPETSPASPQTGSSPAESNPAESNNDDSRAEEPAKAEENQPKEEPKPTPEAAAVSPQPRAAAPAPSKPVPKVPKPAPKPAPAPDVVKQAEAYLYGRGVPQNCERAISMLKGEADKSNVRARSTLGSMYATGHCVSRDLPTAYRYFALVLRTDPENGVASQNLQNLWKQMTPPERQAAMRQQ